MNEAAVPIVEVRGATVRFASDTALDSVDFRMFGGEVHSLMGENGAGKSTLIRALTGARPLDDGTIALDGRTVSLGSPVDAQRHGIRSVYQEIDLLPNLSVAENILLGREPRRRGAIDWRRMRAEASEALLDLGLSIDPASPLGSHSLAVQQLVAIARATSSDMRVLVLDEPTSSLDADEVAELFRIIRELKERGVAILFVSHFLDQVYEICDRITVLRDGALVGEYLTDELLRIDLVQKMLGKDAEALTVRSREPVEVNAPVPVLEARNVSRGVLRSVDLEVMEGEVLGFAGLLGSGRTELARALSGIDRPDSGSIVRQGRRVSLPTPRSAIALGIAYSSENRTAEGIIGQLTVRENIALAIQAERGVVRRLSLRRQRELAASWIEALGIRPASPEAIAGTLSGGNQQKVLLARLLALAPQVLLLDEPTRGIDVGAKVEVQNLVNELADNGMSVVFISSELEEVLRVATRIAVFRGGQVVAIQPTEALASRSLLAIVTQPDDAW
ncbi:MAG: sugar ABC transporter ATP-binding protein [Pseudolysinimonas sp.]